MQVPLVNLQAQFAKLQPEIFQKLSDIFAHTEFIMGRHVEEFERSFADFCKASNAIGVANGTDALMLVYRALGLERGDEVIVPAHTFIATVSPLVQLGIRPVFVDIDPKTYLLDFDRVREALTSKTKAIVAVHLYGQAAPLDRLKSLADTHGLLLIEDCAQAHGATWQGKPVGTWGEVGCFSFYPGKNLGAAGDAGAIITDDKELARRLRLMLNHGSETKYVHTELGLNSRLDALQAGILSIKLRFLEEWTQQRRENAKYYQQILQGIPGLVLPLEDPAAKHVYHLYVVQVPEHRDTVVAHLHSAGVGAGIHYPIPLHLQPVFQELGYTAGALPHTEAAAQRILSLPLCPELTKSQMDYVAETLKKAVLASGKGA